MTVPTGEKYTETQIRYFLEDLHLPADPIMRQAKAYATGTWEVGPRTWLALKVFGNSWTVRLIIKDLP